MSMLPGMNKMKAKMDQANIDEKMLVENEAIILSMTKNERENPKIISGSRRKRIFKGAGVDVSKINKLLKQFKNDVRHDEKKCLKEKKFHLG